jgi:hypothetical protein
MGLMGVKRRRHKLQAGFRCCHSIPRVLIGRQAGIKSCELFEDAPAAQAVCLEHVADALFGLGG